MREHKYKAWDKDAEEMYDVVSYCCSGGDDHGDVEILRNGKYRCLMAKNVEVMQYTGLKDKHGKEIYEGDVVKIEDFALVVVEYRDAKFMLNIDNMSMSLSNFAPRYLEVVGNIYEQYPELRKVG